MSQRWLLALLGLWMAACVCPPEKHQLKAFAPAKTYQDDIKRCEAYGDCDSLCLKLFSLDPDQEALDRCTITRVDDTGVNVNALIELDNACAPDGDLVIDGDGDGYDDGSVIDDGSGSDGTTDDGSGSGSGDDGTVDDGGGDDGSSGGDDGGDDGGDSGGDDSAPKHHALHHAPTGSRA